MKTCPVPYQFFPLVITNFYQKLIIYSKEDTHFACVQAAFDEDLVYGIMMYFNSILNHSTTSKKNTIMDTILKNIKDLRNEFSVSDFRGDGDQTLQLSTTGIASERNKVESDNIDSIKELQKRYQLLAPSNNSKESKALSPTPDDNCSYYSSELECGSQYEYSSNWLSAKFYQRHRESQDSGHSSPEDSRSPSPTYSRILKSQSPTPLSSDDGIDIDSIVIEDDNGILQGKPSVVKDEWQTVLGPRSGPKTPLSTFCDQRALCSKGNKCKNKHTQKEKELFEARKTAKTANDKEFSDTKFRTELCNKVNVPHNRKMCRFAHGIEQLVCKTCYEVGHKKETCTKQEKENLSPVRSH